MNHQPTRSFEVDPAEYPFDSSWFERAGAWMHYVDEGEGLPVILLHGNPTWSYLNRKVIRELGEGFRAIAPDYPGFGFSSHPDGYGYTPQEHAEWLRALVDHLGLERYILVVQDWGGPIGLSLAVDRPESVVGLVIANTWAWVEDGLTFRLFSAAMGGPIGKYLILRHNFFASTLMRRMLTEPEYRTDEAMHPYVAPFPDRESRTGTWVFPWALTHSDAWLDAIESRLPTLADRPVELVMGDRDPGLASQKMVERWRRYFPEAALERVEDAGHYIQEERPDRVAAAVRRVRERAGA